MANKEIIERFNADLNQGLSDEQVLLRKKQKLVNKSKKAFGKSYTEIIISNVFSFFNVLLYVIAGVMIYFAVKYNEPKILFGMFFLIVLLANTVIGLYEDIKARYLLGKLRLITQPKAIVIRNGKQMLIDVQDVVLDDIVLIEKDTQIGVDGIVLQGEVGVNESFITGESVNVFKGVGKEVYSGTFVASGSAYIRADKVGSACLANSLQAKANTFKRSPSEILKSLKRLFLVIGVSVIAMAAFLIITFAVQGKFGNDELLVAGVKSITGSLVAMIPSGLYLLTSTALAVGVIGLSKKKAQVQDFYSVEMLARVDTLCVDKTGTITDGNLVVKKVSPLKASALDGYIAQAVSNVIAATKDKNATATALKAYFDLELSAGVLVALPFSSENKYSGASFKGGKTYIIGAPEFMPLNNKAGVIKRCEEFTKDGYRVVVLGEGSDIIKDNKYSGVLEAVALIVIKDHIREDAAETFAWFRNNGVDIKVISGDSARTVSAIASEAGIVNADKFISLEGMSLEEVKNIALQYTVFGRVTPEQKEVLVIALKEAGKTVAMTGDGVNDILALKRSDCSIAMASGADAAKNISHIILMDSNFARLPAVVDEGRRVVNNLQRTASLFVTKTIFAFAITFIFTMASIIERDPAVQYPFVTNHLYLWEIFTSGYAAFFIALEKNSEKIEGRFLPNVFKKAVPAALLWITSVCIIFLFFVLQRNNLLNIGIYSRDCAVAMCVITYSILGIAFLYKVCSPMSRYRFIIFISIVAINVIFLTVTSIVSLAMNIVEPILQIPYIEMSGPAVLTTAIITIIFVTLYLFVYQIIAIYKGDKNEN